MNRLAIFGIGLSIFIISELFLINSIINMCYTSVVPISVVIMLISCSILFPIAFIALLLRPNLDHFRNGRGLYTDEANSFLVSLVNKFERYMRKEVEERVQSKGHKLILKYDVEDFFDKMFGGILND